MLDVMNVKELIGIVLTVPKAQTEKLHQNVIVNLDITTHVVKMISITQLQQQLAQLLLVTNTLTQLDP